MIPDINRKSYWKLTHLMEEMLEEQKKRVAIIALSETWLKPHISNAQINIPNYQIVRADRELRYCGGALLYIHEDFTILEQRTFSNSVCELAVCLLKPANLLVSSLYRPPNATNAEFSEMLNHLQKFIDKVTPSHQLEILIMGDFNLPCMNWSDISIEKSYPKNTSECSRTLLNFMEKNFLSQYVDIPTRKDNILDLCLTNAERLILTIKSEPTRLSDHNAVSITTGYSLDAVPKTTTSTPCQPYSFRALNLNKADFNRIKDHLRTIDWDWLENLCSPSEFPELLNLTVLQICQLYTPERKAPQKNLNKHIRNRRILRRKKRKLNNQLNRLQSLSPLNLKEIIKVRKKLQSILDQIKDSIYEEKIQEENKALQFIIENPRFFFSYSKKYSKNKCSIGPLLDQKNELQHEHKKMANLLQNQYSSVFSDPNNQDKKYKKIGPNPNTIIENINFTQEEIEKAIGEIGTFSSTIDGDIPALVLKQCKKELSYPIWRIWKVSLESGTIPPQFKLQTITPVHKKGSKALPENYRPISLTSHIIKVFERVLRKKIVQYLEKNKIICRNQHGFRKGRSCLTQLLNHIDRILRNFIESNDTDCIYLDYAKAFDKVDHEILLNKIKDIGIRGKIHTWLQDYLKDRSQTVVVNGQKSHPATVMSGVPQGTVLGPILFLIYINDLHTCIEHSFLSSFADDTRIMKEITSTQNIKSLQEDLDSAVQWSKSNNMKLHTDKFEFLCHSTNRSKELKELPFSSQYYQYTTEDGSEITPTTIVKDLGINITPDLSWSPHINIITNNARKMAGWVLSVFADRSISTMIHLYKTLIRSRVEYCCPVWDPTKLEDIATLEGIQRSYTSRITSISHLHYHDRLKALNLMSLQRRRERYSIVTVYKILHNMSPNDLGLEFVETNRRGIQAKVPKINKSTAAKYQTLYDSSFAVRGPQLWNKVPANITIKPSLESFKSALTAWLCKLPDNPPIQGCYNRNSLLDLNILSINEGGCVQR